MIKDVVPNLAVKYRQQILLLCCEQEKNIKEFHFSAGMMHGLLSAKGWSA